MKIKDLFDKPKIIALVGNVNEGKTNTLYYLYEVLKKKGKFNLWTYRIDLPSNKIYSIEELEKIKNSIIMLDEVMSLWDFDNRTLKKQIESTLRLIHHNNNILILCFLPENIKKFISGKINAIIYKKVTFEDFINGSSVKRHIMNYRGAEKGTTILNLKKGEAIIFDGEHYNKLKIPYYPAVDNKAKNPDIVIKRVRKNVKKNVIKSVIKNVNQNVKGNKKVIIGRVKGGKKKR